MTVSGHIEVLKQTVRVNGTELYSEQRGSGPPVLFIPGATGDSGHFEGVAERLADEFTVVAYDRRGNSHSRAPDGWTQTSIEEQADDSAGLITTLGLEPVGVFGTSGGGAIGLELVRRHPELVVGAVLHEPFLPHVPGEQWVQIDAHNRATFGPILASRGPRAFMEAVLRAMRGDAGFEALDPAQRERMVGNGEAFLLEDAAYPRYRPEESAGAAIQRPVRVLVGEAGAPWAPPMAAWLARRLGTQVITVPGGHGPTWTTRSDWLRRCGPTSERSRALVDVALADETRRFVQLRGVRFRVRTLGARSLAARRAWPWPAGAGLSPCGPRRQYRAAE